MTAGCDSQLSFSLRCAAPGSSATCAVQRHFEHTVTSHFRSRRVHHETNTTAAMLLSLSRLYASTVYPELAARLPSVSPGSLFSELVACTKAAYLFERSVEVIKVLADASSGTPVSSAAHVDTVRFTAQLSLTVLPAGQCRHARIPATCGRLHWPADPAWAQSRPGQGCGGHQEKGEGSGLGEPTGR